MYSVTKTEKCVIYTTEDSSSVIIITTNTYVVFWSWNLRDLAANMHILPQYMFDK